MTWYVGQDSGALGISLEDTTVTFSQVFLGDGNGEFLDLDDSVIVGPQPAPGDVGDSNDDGGDECGGLDILVALPEAGELKVLLGACATDRELKGKGRESRIVGHGTDLRAVRAGPSASLSAFAA